LKPVPCISSILVICDGNYCRSPLGKALLQAAVGPEKQVESAGLTALEGYPPHPLVQQLAAERGLDLSGDRGRQLTQAIALGADLILVMDERQKTDCERLAPSARGRLFLLGHWQPAAQREIPDPAQGGPAAIQRSYEQISRAVSDWVPHLVQR